MNAFKKLIDKNLTITKRENFEKMVEFAVHEKQLSEIKGDYVLHNVFLVSEDQYIYISDSLSHLLTFADLTYDENGIHIGE